MHCQKFHLWIKFELIKHVFTTDRRYSKFSITEIIAETETILSLTRFILTERYSLAIQDSKLFELISGYQWLSQNDISLFFVSGTKHALWLGI